MPDSAAATPSPAQATARVDAETLVIELGGHWRLQAPRPDAVSILAAALGANVRRISVRTRDLAAWDSSLLLFVLHVRTHAADHDLTCELRDLPPAIALWLRLVEPSRPAETTTGASYSFPITRRIGRWTQDHVERGFVMLGFFGECVLGLGRLLAQPHAFRWADAIFQMRRCGAQALGIVGLITFLVGVILAFIGATQFRQVGADVFVADLVGLAILREMGPMMAAIVLAGRTGAAYAAELGNMRLNEEIDALETLGLRPLDFLVLPRLLALVLMMPLLALYADFLGVVGGFFVCQTVLDMNAATYFHRLQDAIGLNDLGTGLFKSLFFGMIVAYAGCLKGMRAERSAIGVGDAATAAVVLGILLIIIADAGFTVVFNTLQW